MNTRKKALKLYIYIVTLGIIAAIALSVFALLETGTVRGILAVAAIVIFASSIVQFLLYRYFYQIKVRNVPKEAREEDFPKIPQQETFPRD